MQSLAPHMKGISDGKVDESVLYKNRESYCQLEQTRFDLHGRIVWLVIKEPVRSWKRAILMSLLPAHTQ